MGYLICDKCGGYYKLEEGESADEFDNCQCGGKLRYIDSIDEYLNGEPDRTKYSNIRKDPFNVNDTDESQQIQKKICPRI